MPLARRGAPQTWGELGPALRDVNREVSRRRLNAPYPRWLRTRTHRRALVLAAAVSLVLHALSGWNADSDGSGLLLLLQGVTAFFNVAAYFAFTRVARVVDRFNAGVLDERQRALRDGLHYRAYTILATVSTALAGLAFARLQWGGGAPTADQILGIAVAVMLLAGTLPAAVEAWTVPDDEPEQPGS